MSYLKNKNQNYYINFLVGCFLILVLVHSNDSGIILCLPDQNIENSVNSQPNNLAVSLLLSGSFFLFMFLLRRYTSLYNQNFGSDTNSVSTMSEASASASQLVPPASPVSPAESVKSLETLSPPYSPETVRYLYSVTPPDSPQSLPEVESTFWKVLGFLDCLLAEFVSDYKIPLIFIGIGFFTLGTIYVYSSFSKFISTYLYPKFTNSFTSFSNNDINQFNGKSKYTGSSKSEKSSI